MKQVILEAIKLLDATEDEFSEKYYRLDRLWDRLAEERARLIDSQIETIERQNSRSDALKLLLVSLIPLSVITAIAAFRRSRAAR